MQPSKPVVDNKKSLENLKGQKNLALESNNVKLSRLIQKVIDRIENTKKKK